MRGSSGFAGFSKGGFSKAQIESFHTEMKKLLPERWEEWGTEQCASNFAVANCPQAMVLPFPKYGNFDSLHDPRESSFLHFIGSHRFNDDVLLNYGNQVIAELNGPGR